jgi:hypothetical protein
MTPPDPTPEPDPLCVGDPLARALAKLRPAPAAMDTNRLLFEAGRVARDRDVAFWRRVTLAQFVALFTFGCLAVIHLARLDALDRQAGPPQVVERVVYLPPPAGPEVAPPPRPAPERHPADYPPPAVFAQHGPDADALAEYLRVRQEVLTAGLGLLPDPGPRPAAPVSADELERSLNLPRGVLAAPHWRPYRPPTPPPDPDGL